MVERQEVQDLYARHQERRGEHLIPEVHDGGQISGGNETQVRDQMERHSDHAQQQNGQLDPTQSAHVARIGQFEQQQTAQPDLKSILPEFRF